jgi:ATP-dependent Lon protease
MVLNTQIGRKDTTALMDQLWTQYSKNANILVACVPLKISTTNKAATNNNATSTTTAKVPPLNTAAKDASYADDPRIPIGADDLFEYGVAARIINFIKHNPSEQRQTRAAYIVTLEGLLLGRSVMTSYGSCD